ncbi:hypothetical protein CYMTET_41595 [Cymbomonas tetramitiformis]|uniref:Uncharacterized protein n=1 Tax=Cymbomonas tetramitiformis TaxID=36881 RepID=A0AAE0C5W0_9CHLO|nr:hypothetical protein CYMTET_41595 [Cymbomonas tetramitiformis]
MKLMGLTLRAQEQNKRWESPFFNPIKVHASSYAYCVQMIMALPESSDAKNPDGVLEKTTFSSEGADAQSAGPSGLGDTPVGVRRALRPSVGRVCAARCSRVIGTSPQVGSEHPGAMRALLAAPSNTPRVARRVWVQRRITPQASGSSLRPKRWPLPPASATPPWVCAALCARRWGGCVRRGAPGSSVPPPQVGSEHPGAMRALLAAPSNTPRVARRVWVQHITTKRQKSGR